MKTTKHLMALGLVLGSMLLPQFSNAQRLAQKSIAITIFGTSPMHECDLHRPCQKPIIL